VRPLRPVRKLPAGSLTPDVVLTRLQRLLSRVGTLTTGTARACGSPLAPRYGSGLLPLRLHSRWQKGDPVLRDRPSEEVHGLCLGPFSPRPRISFTRPARAASWAFWRGRPAGKRVGVLVCAVAAVTSGVTASAHGSKRPVGLTPLGRGFSFAPGGSVPISCVTDRTRLRPEELVIYASRRPSPFRGDRGTSCRCPFPGRPGVSQPCSQRAFQQARK
jgi:hypothetical protein